MSKKFKMYPIFKKQFSSEKAVRSTGLCTKRCFFSIKEGGGVVKDPPECCPPHIPGVENLKRTFLPFLSVPSPSSKKWLKTQ